MAVEDAAPGPNVVVLEGPFYSAPVRHFPVNLYCDETMEESSGDESALELDLFLSDGETTEPEAIDFADEDWRADLYQWLEAHPEPPSEVYRPYTNAWFGQQ